MGKRSIQHPMSGWLASLLICLIHSSEGSNPRISSVAAFVPLPSTQSKPAHQNQCQAPHHHRLMQHHDPVDDDDVSQHEFMMNINENDQGSAAFGRSGGGKNDADNKNTRTFSNLSVSRNKSSNSIQKHAFRKEKTFEIIV